MHISAKYRAHEGVQVVTSKQNPRMTRDESQRGQILAVQSSASRVAIWSHPWNGAQKMRFAGIVATAFFCEFREMNSRNAKNNAKDSSSSQKLSPHKFLKVQATLTTMIFAVQDK